MLRPALLLSALVAASTALAAPAEQITYRTVRYVCERNTPLEVKYVNFGTQGPDFVVLTYRGQQYGLAQALSGSGARYASLYGPTPGDGGLEWWTKGNGGTLSKFAPGSSSDTIPLLSNCRQR